MEMEAIASLESSCASVAIGNCLFDGNFRPRKHWRLLGLSFLCDPTSALSIGSHSVSLASSAGMIYACSTSSSPKAFGRPARSVHPSYRR
jgi:hypothetical protein